jgi:hypothetical protein
MNQVRGVPVGEVNATAIGHLCLSELCLQGVFQLSCTSRDCKLDREPSLQIISIMRNYPEHAPAAALPDHQVEYVN